MTRDEVLAMKPGSKLDLMVCEKVMKWITPWEPFFPSTDIAAAFEAEERAIDKDPSMYIHTLASVVFGYNQVQDISDIRKMCMLIHATPEQRCKAALLAVMDGEDEHERN